VNTAAPGPGPAAGAEFDVVTIGNALVDVLSAEDDRFLERHGLVRGTMTLIDEARAEALYADMAPSTEMSGGGAANTAVGVASFGGRVGYLGRVRDDQLGAVFVHDIRAAGVTFAAGAAPDGRPTGRCLVVVTPDAQRTLNTFLGAAAEFGEDDVDRDLVESAAVTYAEGYLYDEARAKQAIRAAAAAAHAAGRRFAFTLSDPFCVERHRDDFRRLIRDEVDVLFANEAEVCALYEENEFEDAAAHARADCAAAALTRSELGSVVIGGDETHVIPALRFGDVVDTTGAGDLYAAGFLFGLTRGDALEECGRLGALAAGEVISHFGARPMTSLAQLVRRS
jgi:sugar/nucleoside kinase (ribokinase family)